MGEGCIVCPGTAGKMGVRLWAVRGSWIRKLWRLTDWLKRGQEAGWQDSGGLFTWWSSLCALMMGPGVPIPATFPHRRLEMGCGVREGAINGRLAHKAKHFGQGRAWYTVRA